MIREPYGVTPYNNTIDISKTNNFSFVFSGDKLYKAQMMIYEVNTDGTTPLYSSSRLEFPSIYNGDTVTFSVGTLSLNGLDLMWRVKMWEETATILAGNGKVRAKPADTDDIVYPATSSTQFYIGQHPRIRLMNPTEDDVKIQIGSTSRKITSYNYDTGFVEIESAIVYEMGSNYVVKTNYLSSATYYFLARKTPTIAITQPVSSTITSRTANFIGTYSQDNQDSIKYHKWIVKENDKIVYESEKIFSSNLRYTYDNFKGGETYTVELLICTQNDVVETVSKTIYADYSEIGLAQTAVPIVNESSGSIIVNIPKLSFANPTISPSGESFSNDIFNKGENNSKTGVKIPKNEILKYGSLNNLPLVIDPSNFIFSTMLAISPEATGEILTLSSDSEGNKIQFIKTGGELKTMVNGIQVGTTLTLYTNIWLLGPSATDEQAYSWIDSATWSDSGNWKETAMTYPLQIFINSNEIIIYKSTPAGATIKKNIPITLNSEKLNYFTLRGECYVDFAFLTQRFSSNAEIGIIGQYEYNPSWETVPGATVICNYDDSLSSSSGNYLIDEIAGYSIFRKDLDGDEKLICRVNEAPGNRQVYFIDRSAKNKTTYTYKIYPITGDKTFPPMSCLQVYPNWEFWTFTEVKLNSEKGVYESVSNPWQFKLNAKPGSMTINSGRVTHNNLSAYPKSTLGPQRGITQSFSALLGNFNMMTIQQTVNGEELLPREYKDDYKKIEDWINFTKTPNPILVQTTKGLNYLATITSPTIEINEEISAMPTTIGFTLVQIGDLEKEQVVDVYMTE